MSEPRYVRDAHVEMMTNKFKTGKLGGRGYAAVKAEPGEEDFEEDFEEEESEEASGEEAEGNQLLRWSRQHHQRS